MTPGGPLSGLSGPEAARLAERIASLEAERRRIFEDAQREADSMFAQYQLSQLLATGAPLASLADAVLTELIRLCGGEAGALWLAEPTSDRLRLLASVGFAPDVLGNGPGTLGEDIQRITEEASGWVVIPLAEDRPVCLMAVAPSEGRPLDEDGLRVIQLSRHELAVAFRGAQLRETLERERQELTAIVAGATDAIVQVDERTRIVRLNPAAEALLDIPPADALGRTCAEAFGCGTLDDHDVTTCPFAEVVSSGHAVANRELTMIGAQGRLIHLAGSFSPTQGEPAGGVQATAILRDVSAIRALEELREGFVATVSHELRTPLALIRGYAETLLYLDLEPAAQRNYVERIHETTRRLTALVTEILDVAHLNADPVVLERTAVLFGSLVARLQGDLEMTGNRRRIVVDLASDLPPVEVDSGRIGQVLENLVLNAMKYSPPESPVTIGARADGNWLVVTVDDEGVGIPEADRELVLEPFHRARNVRESSTPGTGLGLHIARRLVQAHRGDLAVGDRPDGRAGTRVTFTLPLLTTPRPSATRGGSRRRQDPTGQPSSSATAADG